jgi:hypothetical protein
LLHYSITDKPIKHNNRANTAKQINQILPQIKKEIPFDTKTTECPSCSVPPGMCVLSPIYTKKYMDDLYNVLDTYYIEHINDKNMTNQKNGNRVFMFDDMYLIDLLKLLKGTELEPFLIKYISDIFETFDIPSKYHKRILNESKMPVVRYKNNYGLHMHIDKFRRANGPIVTTSVGADVYVYDMFDVTKTPIQPTRTYFKEGDIILMDGLSRVEYAHGLPSNFVYDNSKNRYALIWLMPKFRVIDKYFSNYFSAWIDTVIKCSCKNCIHKQGGKSRSKSKSKSSSKSSSKSKSKMS